MYGRQKLKKNNNKMHRFDFATASIRAAVAAATTWSPRDSLNGCQVLLLCIQKSLLSNCLCSETL